MSICHQSDIIQQLSTWSSSYMDGHDKIFEKKAETLLAKQAREARLNEREESRVEMQRAAMAEGSASLLEMDSDAEMSETVDYMELDPDFEVK